MTGLSEAMTALALEPRSPHPDASGEAGFQPSPDRLMAALDGLISSLPLG